MKTTFKCAENASQTYGKQLSNIGRIGDYYTQTTSKCAENSHLLYGEWLPITRRLEVKYAEISCHFSHT
ncbi:MAG: hypothetical protein IJV27_07980 [Prevotella sp.]|nr:hypothetical protein [Prevotella sp.]